MGRSLRATFFAMGVRGCAPAAGCAACRSPAAGRWVGVTRAGAATSLCCTGRSAGDSWATASWGANCWGVTFWAADVSGAVSLRAESLRRGLLRGDFSGYGIPACETLGHRHPGYEQLRLGVPLHRRLGRGRQGCGLVLNGRRLPAIRRRLFSCRAVGFGRDLDRARVRPRACRHPGEAAPRQAVPIKKPPALLCAGGVSRRIGGFCCDQGPVDGQKQDRYADSDHAPERNQGCGDHKTQMRVQGPSP